MISDIADDPVIISMTEIYVLSFFSRNRQLFSPNPSRTTSSSSRTWSYSELIV